MGRIESRDKYIENRVLSIVNYIINNKATLRETAKVFGVSRATVYLDATERIAKINLKLAIEVEKVLLYNKSQRYIRSGIATKKKWQSMK